MRRVRLSISFSTALWLAASALCAWLWLTPLVRNYWASKTWKQAPCRVSTTINTYTYRVGDKYYYSNRRDFWQVKYDDGRPTSPVSDTTDTCWVNPDDPTDAVRFLDASAHPENGAGRFAAGAALLVAVLLVTRLGKRPAPDSPPAGNPPQGGNTT